MTQDPIGAGVLRHLERAGRDPAIRELARELLAGRITPRGARRTYAEPLAALSERALANWRALSPDELRRYQEQAAAIRQAPEEPPSEPPRPRRRSPEPDADEDAWVDRSLFD